MMLILFVIMTAECGRLCVTQALDVKTVRDRMQALCTRLNLSLRFVSMMILKPYRNLSESFVAQEQESTQACGLHCHIDASRHTPKTLRNIVNIMAAKEDLLYKALKVNVSREHYCQKMDTRFLDEINNRPPMSMEQFKSMWYDGEDYSYRHYDDTRYHALNLHSVFYKGTIEFRLFNSTLHAGEVKSAIQLCLAISHQALIQKSARYAKTVSDNEKYTFRTWLLRLGLIGDEFKTARHHLLKNLDGNIAWKDPAQAERQKERLAQRQVSEINNTIQNTNENINELESETADVQNEDSSFVMSM